MSGHYIGNKDNRNRVYEKNKWRDHTYIVPTADTTGSQGQQILAFNQNGELAVGKDTFNHLALWRFNGKSWSVPTSLPTPQGYSVENTKSQSFGVLLMMKKHNGKRLYFH